MALFFYDCTNNCRGKLVRPGEGRRDERKPRACGQIYSAIATLQATAYTGGLYDRFRYQAAVFSGIGTGFQSTILAAHAYGW